MPRRLSGGRESHKKAIKPKDRIFMVGGKVGKDGIHGATFSSAELNESSPTSAVQLGDPFTQKIMIDFLLESRDKGLHSGLTDDGAGGLSSSIGELATLTGGVVVEPAMVRMAMDKFGPPSLIQTERRQISIWNSWPFMILLIGHPFQDITL